MPDLLTRARDEGRSIHAIVEAERKAALPEAAQVKVYRDYARGRQRSTLSAGYLRILRGLLGNLFCDNVCRVILKAIRDRLRIVRFEAAAEGGDADRLDAFLEDLGVKNRLLDLANAVHWDAPRDGNHAVSLSWNGERVVLSRERYWNGDNGLFVAYDDSDTPVWAVKDWREGTRRYRTIWEPALLHRFVGEGGGWRYVAEPGQAAGGPVPWVVPGTNEPLGIPCVHFAHRTVPNEGPGNDNLASGPASAEPDSRQGMSELDGGVLGLQDQLNDQHRMAALAARFTGGQIYTATGTTLKDAQNNPVPWRPEPGAAAVDPSKDARFGVLPAGSIEQLKAALSITLEAVARHSDVPIHEFAGNWPSGQALLTAQMGLIEKVETIGAGYGPAWSSVAHKAVVLTNAFGRAALDEEILITTVFAPVSRRDPLTRAEIARAEAEYVSLQQTLRTLGYSPKQIERILREREEEAKRFRPREAVDLDRARETLEADRAARIAGGAAGIAERLRAGGGRV